MTHGIECFVKVNIRYSYSNCKTEASFHFQNFGIFFLIFRNSEFFFGIFTKYFIDLKTPKSFLGSRNSLSNRLIYYGNYYYE